MAPGGQKESSVPERELAVKLKREGKTTGEIARLLGRSKKWVNIWWAKSRKPGGTTFKNKKRTGRKTKLTAADKAQITALMKDKPGRSHRKALVDDYWTERVRKVFEKNGDNNFK